MADQPVVITGIGLTSPNGNSLSEMRRNLLAGVSGVTSIETRHMGRVFAGVCDFDERRYQKVKDRRRGTRAGAIAIYCAGEALADARLNRDQLTLAHQGLPLDHQGLRLDRVGVFLGITEHGTVETENEIAAMREYGDDVKFWSHHHNPRTVANNPAGEVTLNLGITGPHYTIGAACAAGNAGLIQGVQMLRLGEVDLALAGGVSEAIHSFGIFASFAAQDALARGGEPAKASRPFDRGRCGIVVSEGGCVFVLERLADAQRRGAKLYGRIAGYAMNSDASDPVIPNTDRMIQCMQLAVQRAGLKPEEINLISSHATSTPVGDQREAAAIREMFGDDPQVLVNNTKSYIGHAMGAAGALELAGNLPSFDDGVIHPTINIAEVDPECRLAGLVINQPVQVDRVAYLLNSSFGMLGTNSVVVVAREPRVAG